MIFADAVRELFSYKPGKPVLLADSAGPLKQRDGTMRNDPAKYRDAVGSLGPRARIASTRDAIAAADLLKKDWGVEADLWSCPSFNELARDGQDCERWNLLHPMEEPRKTHVQQKLAGFAGPVVAATDYIRMFPEQIRAHMFARLAGDEEGLAALWHFDDEREPGRDATGHGFHAALQGGARTVAAAWPGPGDVTLPHNWWGGSDPVVIEQTFGVDTDVGTVGGGGGDDDDDSDDDSDDEDDNMMVMSLANPAESEKAGLISAGVGGAQMVRHGQTGYFVGGSVVAQADHEIKMYWSSL